jgi:hypothetical protein
MHKIYYVIVTQTNYLSKLDDKARPSSMQSPNKGTIFFKLSRLVRFKTSNNCEQINNINFKGK